MFCCKNLFLQWKRSLFLQRKHRALSIKIADIQGRSGREWGCFEFDLRGVGSAVSKLKENRRLKFVPICAAIGALEGKARGVWIWSIPYSWNRPPDGVGPMFRPLCRGDSWKGPSALSCSRLHLLRRERARRFSGGNCFMLVRYSRFRLRRQHIQLPRSHLYRWSVKASLSAVSVGKA